MFRCDYEIPRDSMLIIDSTLHCKKGTNIFFDSTGFITKQEYYDYYEEDSVGYTTKYIYDSLGLLLDLVTYQTKRFEEDSIYFDFHHYRKEKYHVIEVFDSTNNFIERTYLNNRNQTIKHEYPSNNSFITTEYRYDEMGNLIEQKYTTKSTSWIRKIYYDNKGRIERESTAGNLNDKRRFHYNNDGWVYSYYKDKIFWRETGSRYYIYDKYGNWIKIISRRKNESHPLRILERHLEYY